MICLFNSNEKETFLLSQLFWLEIKNIPTVRFEICLIEMKLATLVQILNKAVCILLHANALGRSMNPSLFLLSMELRFLALIRQPVEEKGNSEFKPSLMSCLWWPSQLGLKNIPTAISAEE